MEKVTVVLPFHRNEDIFLNEAIKSVLNSSGVDIELILVDNRVKSSELNIYKDDRIITLRNKVPGYGLSLNMGIALASSKWVALMNSDDLVLKDKLFSQVELMKLENTDLCITGMQKFGRWAKVNLTGDQPRSGYSPYLLFLGAYGANATLMFNSEKIPNMKFSREFHADWILGMEYYFDHSISYINKPKYLYRTHVGQITHKLTDLHNDLYSFYSKAFLKQIGLAIAEKEMKALAFPYSDIHYFSSREKDLLLEKFKQLRKMIQNEEIQINQLDRILYRRAIGILKNTHDFLFFLRLTKELSIGHLEFLRFLWEYCTTFI